MKNKWTKFAPFYTPEGVGDGGGAAADALDPAAATGEGAAAASVETPSPATFLTEKAGGAEGEGAAATEKEGEAKTEAGAEASPAFDLTTVTLPEGFTLDEEAGKAFADLISDDKLTPQERGQKFMDLHTSALKTATESIAAQVKQANLEAYTKMNQDWRDQIKTLPEYKENPEAEAGKVMQALISVGAGEEFFKAIDLTGAGNNPAILQILHRLASPHFEGAAVVGAGKAASARKLGDNIYTSTNKS